MEGHQPLTATSLSIVPANQVPWDDLKAVFGDRDSGRCNCQRFKTRGWFWEQATDEQRRVSCGTRPTATTRPRPRRPAWWRICTTRTPTRDHDPEATPVGWVAVEPRTEYPRLLGLPTVWKGRPDEDKQDDSVWAVTCFVVRKGYRRRGITYALAEAAVGYARANGARALEGYAMLTQPGREITWGELHVGAARSSPGGPGRGLPPERAPGGHADRLRRWAATPVGPVPSNG